MWWKIENWWPAARHVAGAMAIAALLSALHTQGLAAAPASKPKIIQICHGYACAYRSRLTLSPADGARFRSIMSAGAASPKAERAALSKAVQYFDRRAASATGFRDMPKTQIGKPRRGQMDCIDESTNTRALLFYLSERGMLKFHKVGRNVSRGYFLDGRYPHFSAVISDPAGVKWVVDPWYAQVGGAPDIIPHEDWKLRGQLERGAAN